MIARDLGMETGGGEGGEAGLVMKKKGGGIDDRYRGQPQPGLQG